MSQEILIEIKCTQCNGTGTHTQQEQDGTPYEGDCQWPGCVDGFIETLRITLDPGLDDILDKCNDILDKCNDILEEVQE